LQLPVWLAVSHTLPFLLKFLCDAPSLVSNFDPLKHRSLQP
jgi:hypothetical protein